MAIQFDLKPCPFCEAEATITAVEGGGFKVNCCNFDCGCSLPAWLPFEKDDDVFEKIALAVKYWNCRQPGGEFGRRDGQG